MAGISSEEVGVGMSLEGSSGGQQRYQSSEALVEWRSSEQLENGTPSTSPPYWDSDGEDGGPKPSELYGKYTWKIDKFSQINKRELRSNAFEVGGYKWYILIYPQGCDVCNHLSLFLCVANHDKLLPGWSHFAQFTIAVVNKDPKKSKYSDTLHRFWKKEHDWGWKKFMELSKVLDGFIDADTLIIKAQVQVIRERADRPFRCLDCQYRRELVRVYLTNVEQICRRFVEERRGKLGKLIEDKSRWASFCTFWLEMDQSARRCMSWEKADTILKVVVKHFFIEKEVTSTLVMDSLYSGMKALEGQGDKTKGKHEDLVELPAPIVHMEKDLFVLVDDVLLLLERAALEPLPPKDEKGPQNRTKDGNSGEDFNKDSIERDERRLTELGRRTIEIFVLAHIFSKIEVAYQEAVALKRQEELIREEEAAWLAESEQKARRGVDKEKKSKKKQGKQKRNNRKTKDKGKDEKLIMVPAEPDSPIDESKNVFTEEPEGLSVKVDATEDISDVSDSVDFIPEILPPDARDGEQRPGNWEIETSELHTPFEASSSEISSVSAVQNGLGERSLSAMDDSSSTCSTDSVVSALNGFNKGNHSYHKNRKSPKRRSERGKSSAVDWSNGHNSQPTDSVSDIGNVRDVSRSCKPVDTKSQAALCSSEDQVKRNNQLEQKKDEVSPSRRILGMKGETEVVGSFKEKMSTVPFHPRSPAKDFSSVVELKSESNISNFGDYISDSHVSEGRNKPEESGQELHPTDITGMSSPGTPKPAIPNTSDNPSARQVPAYFEKPSTEQVPVSAGKPSSQVLISSEKTSIPSVPVSSEKPSTSQAAVMSRPLSTLAHGSRPVSPAISMVQTPPILACSSSAAGRLGPEPSTTSQSYVPQTYRNVMMGNTVAVSGMSFAPPHSPSAGVNSVHPLSQSSALLSKPLFSPQNSERMEVLANHPSFSFGLVKQDMLPNGQHWMEVSQRGDILNKSHAHLSSNEIRNIDLYKPMQSRSHNLLPEFGAGTSGRPVNGLGDEFPHIDIINDLLEDDAIGKASVIDPNFHNFSNGPQHFHRQFSFPGEIAMSSDLGPSTSSCRFERTLSYHDGLHRSYTPTSPGIPYETLREMMPQPNFRPYANGYTELISNQWQMDRPYISTRDTDNDGYAYHNPAEFLNMVSGRNNYSGFHPSNGH